MGTISNRKYPVIFVLIVVVIECIMETGVYTEGIMINFIPSPSSPFPELSSHLILQWSMCTQVCKITVHNGYIMEEACVIINKMDMKVWYLHTMKHYYATDKDIFELFMGRWKHLETINIRGNKSDT